LINGDPIVCGNVNIGVPTADCFHYERDAKKWKKVRILKYYKKGFI